MTGVADLIERAARVGYLEGGGTRATRAWRALCRSLVALEPGDLGGGELVADQSPAFIRTRADEDAVRRSMDTLQRRIERLRVVARAARDYMRADDPDVAWCLWALGEAIDGLEPGDLGEDA